VYAHVDKLVDRGLLTVDELGLAAPTPAPVVELGASSGLVPRQATFARLTTSRSIRSCACRLRQAM
jgi:hypothetical protein